MPECFIAAPTVPYFERLVSGVSAKIALYKYILFLPSFLTSSRIVITQRRNVVKSVGCFLSGVCLCVCLFVCQHDNFQTSKHRMMKLRGRCTVQKYRPSSNLGVIAPCGCTHPKMWRWATTLGKSAQAVQFVKRCNSCKQFYSKSD